MMDEEYLRACGWTPRPGGWDPPPHSDGGATYDVYPVAVPTARAVERQLAEDRARLAFVAGRALSNSG